MRWGRPASVRHPTAPQPHCVRQNSPKQGCPQEEMKKSLGNANRKERLQGRSLLHGKDMGETQYHRKGIEQWLAVGGGRRLVAVGGWRR